MKLKRRILLKAWCLLMLTLGPFTVCFSARYGPGVTLIALSVWAGALIVIVLLVQLLMSLVDDIVRA